MKLKLIYKEYDGFNSMLISSSNVETVVLRTEIGLSGVDVELRTKVDNQLPILTATMTWSNVTAISGISSFFSNSGCIHGFAPDWASDFPILLIH